MEFKKGNTRQIIIISLAGLFVVGVIIIKLIHKKQDMPTTQESQPVPIVDTNIPAVVKTPAVTVVTPSVVQPAPQDGDSEMLKNMMTDMEKDREQQRRIKDLKMQKEEIDLQVEEQQSLSELGKLKRDNIDAITDSNASDASAMDIKIVFLGGTDSQKQAILSINGTEYSVKVNDRPLKNIEIKSISDNEVSVHFLAPKNITTVYQYKSE